MSDNIKAGADIHAGDGGYSEGTQEGYRQFVRKRQRDSEGRPPAFIEGERVYVLPLKMEATVIQQILHFDYPESFWGNVQLRYDDGMIGESNSWQLQKL